MDTGNNNYIETIAKCNFPPYGRDFVGGKPTAEELGIKELVPPYLDPNLQLQDLKTGVCFASGGTGYDPLTPILAVHTISSRGKKDWSIQCTATGMYTITENCGWRITTKKLCRKVQPSILLFNSKLNTTIDSLNKNLPDSRIVYVDVYNPFLDIIENPQNYGFHVADRGCCGTGDIEVAVLCTLTPTTCVNASDYIFWDSYHPTEAVYRTLISQFLPKYINSFF
uniref:Uncharacterized protein n=1 Tax=Quercus lobata TaxID=97700 RepID=A0A7N2QYG7_QUELO